MSRRMYNTWVELRKEMQKWILQVESCGDKVCMINTTL